jgi:hypothetical protein
MFSRFKNHPEVVKEPCPIWLPNVLEQKAKAGRKKREQRIQ